MSSNDNDRQSMLLRRQRKTPDAILDAETQAWCISRWFEVPSDRDRLALVEFALTPVLLRILARKFHLCDSEACDFVQMLWSKMLTDPDWFFRSTASGAPATVVDVRRRIISFPVWRVVDAFKKEKSHNAKLELFAQSQDCERRDEGPRDAIIINDMIIEHALFVLSRELEAHHAAAMDAYRRFRHAGNENVPDWPAIAQHLQITQQKAKDDLKAAKKRARAILVRNGIIESAAAHALT